jgi:uncharacterized protein DUF1565
MASRAVLAVALAWLAGACGAEETELPVPVTPTGCAVGDSVTPTGSCCPPATLPRDDGSCLAAGIPPEACAPGFEPDDRGGCEPVLPRAPCDPGQLALPGDASCHEIMPCGAAPYGDIAVTADTKHVDAAYAGGQNDGTAAHPFTTIQAAIDAAAPGGLVAVAAGSYTEDIDIDRSIQVRGRCPSMVDLVGQGAVSAVLVHADGAVFAGMAVTGPTIGVVVSGAVDARLESLWVHDTVGRGIDFENFFGPVSATIGGTLVEKARDASIILLSSDATIEGTVIRDPEVAGNGLARGLVVKHLMGSAVRSTAVVSGSIIERVRGGAILVEGSDLSLGGCVLRDVFSEAATLLFGRAIELQYEPGSLEPSTATITQSLIERSRDAAILVAASSITVDATVVRDTTAAESDDLYGYGLSIYGDVGRRADAHVTASVFERNTGAGLAALAADLVVESAILRDTLPGNLPVGDMLRLGAAVLVQDDLDAPSRGVGTVRGSLVAGNLLQALRVTGSDLLLEWSAVVDTLPAEDARFGQGLAAVYDDLTGQRSAVIVHGGSFERNHDTAILVHESDAVLDGFVVRDTLPRALDGAHGFGIAIQHIDPMAPRPTATITNVLVERVTGVATCIFQADVTITASRMSQIGVQPLDGLFGDGIAVLAGSLELHGSRVEQAQRAGVASFGASILLEGSVLDCNGITLAAQQLMFDPVFTDAGGNRCGCGEVEEVCKALGGDLAPPSPVD